MKVCIVTPYVVKGDGQGRVNYEIAWEAIRRGHHVTLLARSAAEDLQQNSLVNWIDISVKGLPTELARGRVFAWRSAAWLQKHRQEFDIVHANGAVTIAPADVNLVPFVHSAWLRSPVHISRVRRDFYGLYQWFYTFFNARWERQAFARAKAVVAVSQRVKQELLDIGVPKERIPVILCGVDLQEFSPGKGDRKKYGLPEQVPLAFFMGDIKTNRKNLDTVLHALVRVPNLHLAVVGNPIGSPYPQLAAQLEISDRVHFLGRQPDVSAIMRSVDFFVFPSRYEPYGLVIIEAMASGLPVITATGAGAAEIVTPECGIVLPDTEDVNALAGALATLASDRDLRERMGSSARSVAEQHGWANMAKQYVDLFEELASHERQDFRGQYPLLETFAKLAESAEKVNSVCG